MRVTVDSYDGRGAVDYSDAIAAEGPVQIERLLNKPAVCTWMLMAEAAPPTRLGRVVVTKDNGTVLFTGYLPREPQLVYAGEATAGSVYRLLLKAESDEWLLDRQGLRVGGESFAVSGATLLKSLTSRVDGVRFTTAATGTISNVGRLQAEPGKTWSENAAAIADAAGASYRVLSGQVAMAALGSVSHAMSTTDGGLSESGLEIATTRDLVNDVTISGQMEAGTYVTEIFVGDGTTTEFQMSAAPFAGTSVKSRELVAEAFQAATLDPQRWMVSDPGSHIGLGAGGLLLTGGNGLDGQTTLAATTAIELGGTILLEAASVTLGQGSAGILLGLYAGSTSYANCVAGFSVQTSGGATVIGCLVNGAAAGTTFSLASGHVYTLRLHVHAVEMQRVRQTYFTMVDGALQQFGGGLVGAPFDLVFELQDLGSSSNTPAIVLFDGSFASSPASASFVPVNSVQLLGSVGGISATRTGSVWVRSTPSSGAPVTRIAGVTGTGADYSVSSAGVLRFYAGRVPAAGEQIVVRYRRGQRAVARRQSPTSVGSEAASGLPGVAAWFGSVVQPPAYSAEDCAAAAAATLAVATSRAAALAGRYEGEVMQDIWPGDLLQLNSGRGVQTVIARSVLLKDTGSLPERIQQEIGFANDWGGCVSIRLSGTMAADALVPAQENVAWTTASTGGLQVVSVSTSVLEIDTGTAPPTNGGFEVRRSDGGFGAGQGGNLVLRSGVRGIAIPRGAQVERFYVRMYDGATPPNYSRLSSALVTNVPVA